MNTPCTDILAELFAGIFEVFSAIFLFALVKTFLFPDLYSFIKAVILFGGFGFLVLLYHNHKYGDGAGDDPMYPTVDVFAGEDSREENARVPRTVEDPSWSEGTYIAPSSHTFIGRYRRGSRGE